MLAQHLGHGASGAAHPDAMLPQFGLLALIAGAFSYRSAKVDSGYTQVASISDTRADADCAALFKNSRRRGCRRAQKSFWHFAWWLSLPHAPRKQKKSYSLTRLSSKLRPQSTDPDTGRVLPAPFHRAAWPRFAVGFFS